MKEHFKTLVLVVIVVALIYHIMGYAGQSDYENAIQSQNADLPHWEGQP